MNDNEKLNQDLAEFLRSHGVEHYVFFGIQGELKPGFAETVFFNYGHKVAVKKALLAVLIEYPEMFEFYKSVVDEATRIKKSMGGP